MRAALAVFRDELAARGRFLLLALGAGLIPFAAVGFYHHGGASPADVRGATAMAIAGTLGLLLAIGFGSSLFAPELASGRLRYWLSRPVSTTSLWLGRNAAALGAIYASVLLALVPTTLAGDLGWHTIDSISISYSPGTPRVYLLFALLGLALVFFLCQGLGLLERSRSRWLALDLLGLAAVGSTLGATGSRLFWAGALVARISIGLLFALALLLALALAGFVSLRRGRADLTHTHRLFSLTLWCALGLATSALGAYAWSTLHPRPERLRLDTSRVIAPADASWFALSGDLSGRSDLHGLFVCEDTSRSCRHLGFDLQSFQREGLSAAAAPGGGTLLWLGWSGTSLARFAAELPGGREPITLPFAVGRSWEESSALSADGSRMAVLSPGRLTLLRPRDGGVIRTLPLAGLERLGFPGSESRFVDERSLLVAHLARDSDAQGAQLRAVRLQSIDLERGELRDLGRVAAPSLSENVLGSYALSLSPHGRFLAVRPWRRDPQATEPEVAAVVRITSAAESGLEPVLASSLARSTALPTWLADDSALWMSRAQNELTLHWLASDTGEVRDITLPGVRRFVPVAVRGEILVASLSGEAGPPLAPNPYASSDSSAARDAPSGWRAVAIQLATGEIRSLGDGLRSIPPTSTGAPLGKRALFVDSRGRVVELDPATGAKEVWFTAQLDRDDRE